MEFLFAGCCGILHGERRGDRAGNVRMLFDVFGVGERHRAACNVGMCDHGSLIRVNVEVGAGVEICEIGRERDRRRVSRMNRVVRQLELHCQRRGTKRLNGVGIHARTGDDVL